jgi:hypothetical protein
MDPDPGSPKPIRIWIRNTAVYCIGTSELSSHKDCAGGGVGGERGLELDEVGAGGQVALKGGRRQRHRVTALVTHVILVLPASSQIQVRTLKVGLKIQR